MGQEEAASAGRFVSHLAPARKTPNGTDGKRAPCVWLARAIRRANRAGANAGARTCDTRENRNMGKGCAGGVVRYWYRSVVRVFSEEKGRAAGNPAAV